MFDAELVTGGIEVINALTAEWSALCDRSCREPFLRPEWFAAFVQHVRCEIQLVAVRERGELCAVLPLISPKRSAMHGVPVTTVGGLSDLNSPRFGLVGGHDGPEVIDTLWRRLRKADNWQVLEFRLVKGDDRLAGLLRRAERDGYRTGVWSMDAAPFIELPSKDRFSTFFSGPRKHFGKEMDRRLRRLKELGEAEFVVVRDYSREMIDRYLTLEARGWKGDTGTAAIMDGSVAELHHRFASECSQAGRLAAYELRLDSRTIAMSLNVEDGDRVFHWKTTYDEQYARYSPGNLLFRRLFQDYTSAGFVEIDLMSPVSPNKRMWSTGEREHVAFYVFRPNVIGQLVWAWKFLVIQRLRRLKGMARYMAANAQ